MECSRVKLYILIFLLSYEAYTSIFYYEHFNVMNLPLDMLLPASHTFSCFHLHLI